MRKNEALSWNSYLETIFCSPLTMQLHATQVVSRNLINWKKMDKKKESSSIWDFWKINAFLEEWGWIWILESFGGFGSPMKIILVLQTFIFGEKNWNRNFLILSGEIFWGFTKNCLEDFEFAFSKILGSLWRFGATIRRVGPQHQNLQLCFWLNQLPFS